MLIDAFQGWDRLGDNEEGLRGNLVKIMQAIKAGADVNKAIPYVVWCGAHIVFALLIGWSCVALLEYGERLARSSRSCR